MRFSIQVRSSYNVQSQGRTISKTKLCESVKSSIKVSECKSEVRVKVWSIVPQWVYRSQIMKIQGAITWKLNIKTVYGSVKSSQSVSQSIVPLWV